MTTIVTDIETLDRLIRSAVTDALAQTQGDHPVVDPDQLLSVKDAAALVGMSENAMRLAVHSGKIPSLQLGRARRVKRSALLAAWNAS